MIGSPVLSMQVDLLTVSLLTFYLNFTVILLILL